MYFTEYYSGDQVNDDEIDRTSSTHGRDEKYIQCFRWKAWREGLLGRPRCRWEDNIRMNLIEIECEVVHWMRILTNVVGGVLKTVMELRFP